jgi:hypothetical protein
MILLAWRVSEWMEIALSRACRATQLSIKAQDRIVYLATNCLFGEMVYLIGTTSE